MEISAAIQSLLQVRKAETPDLLSQLKPGLQLNAKVIAGTQQGLAELLLRGQTLSARTELPLRSGEILTLLVEKGLPLPTLKLIRANTPPPSEQLIRHALSRQIPSKQVLDNLRQLIQGSAPRSSNQDNRTISLPQFATAATPLKLLAPQLSTSLMATGSSNNILSALSGTRASDTIADSSPLPRPHADLSSLLGGSAEKNKGLLDQILRVLMPEAASKKGSQRTPADNQVQTALRDSGLFFEHRLVTQGTPPKGDLKLQLLQLLRLLSHEPDATAQREANGDTQTQNARTGNDLIGRLLRLIEGSLARIQAQQTASLPDDSGKQQWHFELPVSVDNQREFIQLKLQRESAASEDESSHTVWKVDLYFDFDNLGPVQAQVSLRDGRFCVAFQSELASTAQKIEHAGEQLQKQFANSGLAIDRFSSGIGSRETNRAHKTLGLLDEHA